MNKIMFVNRLRFVSQMCILIFFIILPWTALAIGGIYGTLYALEVFGVPFADPVAATQILATLNNPGWMLLTGAFISISIAMIFGRIFCSWICPYGFISELIFKLSSKIHSPLRIIPYVGKKNLSKIFILKSFLIFFAILLFIFFSIPLLQFLSFPGELSRAPIFAWQNDYTALLICLALPLILLAFEFIIGRRFWCVYLCPQSLLLGVAAGILPSKFPGLRINWVKNACTCKKEFSCSKICDLGLDPRRKYLFSRALCSHCGKCVEECSKKGKALGWALKAE